MSNPAEASGGTEPAEPGDRTLREIEARMGLLSLAFSARLQSEVYCELADLGTLVIVREALDVVLARVIGEIAARAE